MASATLASWDRTTPISIDRASPRTPIRALTSLAGTSRPGPRIRPHDARHRGRRPGCRRARCRGSSNDVSTSVPIAEATRERVLLAARTWATGRTRWPAACAVPRRCCWVPWSATSRDPFFAGADRGAGGRVRAARLQRRARDARAARRGVVAAAVLETRHCDAIVLLGDMQDQPRLLEDLGHSIVPGRRALAGLQPAPVPDRGRRRRRRHPRRPRAPRRARPHADRDGQRPAAGRQPAATRRVHRVHASSASASVRPDYIQDVPNTMAGGEAALDALLELDDPPTALVTSTDLVAIGVLHAAYSRGRIVPRELSVVGFDDIPIAAHTAPALTTLRMPITEMVREGVRQAVGFAQDPTAPARGAHPVVRSDARRPRIHGAARGPRPDDRHGPGRAGLTRRGQPPASAGAMTGSRSASPRRAGGPTRSRGWPRSRSRHRSRPPAPRRTAPPASPGGRRGPSPSAGRRHRRGRPRARSRPARPRSPRSTRADRARARRTRGRRRRGDAAG